jgi:hypothetical protein
MAMNALRRRSDGSECGGIYQTDGWVRLAGARNRVRSGSASGDETVLKGVGLMGDVYTSQCVLRGLRLLEKINNPCENLRARLTVSRLPRI